MPGTEHKHTAKWRSCVEQVSEKNPDVDPYAVCTAQLGPSLLTDDMVDTDDGQPFVWNGAGALGKPFKRKLRTDLAPPISEGDVTPSEAASKAWETRHAQGEKATADAAKPGDFPTKTQLDPKIKEKVDAVFGKMKDDGSGPNPNGAEANAFMAGYNNALAEGFTGEPADFLVEQAALYQHADETDPRFKTFLSGDTLDQLKAAGDDVWGEIQKHAEAQKQPKKTETKPGDQKPPDKHGAAGGGGGGKTTTPVKGPSGKAVCKCAADMPFGVAPLGKPRKTTISFTTAHAKQVWDARHR